MYLLWRHRYTTVEHTALICERWNGYRNRVNSRIGELDPNSMIKYMLQAKQRWKMIHTVMDSIMRNIEAEELKIQKK